MTQSKLISIVTMWSKITELSRQSLSQTQIALKLGICRDTVRRYQQMSVLVRYENNRLPIGSLNLLPQDNAAGLE